MQDRTLSLAAVCPRALPWRLTLSIAIYSCSSAGSSGRAKMSLSRGGAWQPQNTCHLLGVNKKNTKSKCERKQQPSLWFRTIRTFPCADWMLRAHRGTRVKVGCSEPCQESIKYWLPGSGFTDPREG